MKFFIWIFMFYGIMGHTQQMPDSIAQKLEKLTNYEVYADPQLNYYIDDAGDELFNYLQEKKITKWESKTFYVTSTKDSSLVTYTFSYHSGGTAGRMFFSIAQWPKNSGGFSCEKLYEDQYENNVQLTGNPFEIIPLSVKDNLFLILNGHKEDSRVEVGSALMVKIEKGSLILNNKGFNNNYSELIFWDDIEDNEYCIACISFNIESRELIIEDVGELDKVTLTKNFDNSKVLKPLSENKIYFEFRHNSFRLRRGN